MKSLYVIVRKSHYQFHIVAFCPSVTSPQHGNVTVMSNGKVSSASYMCDLGFVINGKSNIACTSSAKWESTPPVCGRFLNSYLVCE